MLLKKDQENILLILDINGFKINLKKILKLELRFNFMYPLFKKKIHNPFNLQKKLQIYVNWLFKNKNNNKIKIYIGKK